MSGQSQKMESKLKKKTEQKRTKTDCFLIFILNNLQLFHLFYFVFLFFFSTSLTFFISLLLVFHEQYTTGASEPQQPRD